MKHLKQRSHFTVNNNLLSLPRVVKITWKAKWREFRAYTAPGIMLVMIMVVIFHKTVVVLFSNEKTCSQTSCTSVYNQYQFLNKVDLCYCSTDNFLLIISKRPHGAVMAVVPVVSVDSLLLFFPSCALKLNHRVRRVDRTHSTASHLTLSITSPLTQCKGRGEDKEEKALTEI